MADLENTKIYRRVSNSGTDQYAVVNLDATNFCITLNSQTSTLASQFDNINTWGVWKRDTDGHVTVATPYYDTDAANKGYVDSAVTTYTIGTSGNSISLYGSDGSVDTKELSGLNADTTDNLHLNDQSYAYKGKLSISLGIVNAVVHTGLTEAEIFALSGNRYGHLYLATDTSKYWRRYSTSTVASASYWRDDTADALASLQLPNQVTTEGAVYIKLNLTYKYYIALPKFFVSAPYDNISGSTTITGFCRQRNQFDITSCSYNGNNLQGIYQASNDTDIYYFKLRKPSGGYGGSPDGLKATITIYYNFYQGTPQISFIDKNNSAYNTVANYGYVSVPAYGNRRTSINYSLYSVSDNAYDLGSASNRWRYVYASTVYENNVSLTNKYAAKSHTHLWSDITDKPSTFAPSAHTHSLSDITDVATIGTTAASTAAISTSSASIVSGNTDLVTGGAVADSLSTLSIKPTVSGHTIIFK